MKKQLLTLLLGVITFGAFAQVPSYVPTNGLVGYWPFDGNAQDASGNGNHGTVNGATSTTDRNGNANKAFIFNGLNNFIGLTPLNLSFSNKITISVWVKPSDITTTQDQDIIRQTNGVNTLDWLLCFSNYGTKIKFGLGVTGSYTELIVPINSSIYNNSWHHIVAIYDGNKKSIYCDGVILGTETKTGNITYASDETLSIGSACPSVNCSEWYPGIIDDIIIWSQALTQQEITALYNSCSTPTATITPQGITTFCQGGSVVLNASTGTGYTYEWYKDGSIITGATASSYSATQSGNYTVKVINGSCNATSSATAVTVNPNPTATITAGGAITFCQGGSVNLTASSATNNTYQWYNNGNSISGATSSVYSATQSGNYTVKVTNGACNATSTATVVTVNTNPTVTFTTLASYTDYHRLPITLVASPAGGTFSGPGVSGVLFNPSLAGLGKKIVTYNYTNANNCSGSASQSTIVNDTLGIVCTAYDTISVTDTLFITTTLGLTNPTTNTLKIYPNPAKDHLTINNGNFASMSNYSIRIDNALGQQVFSSVINQPSFYIDLSTWSGDGVYFVYLKDAQGTIKETRKIVLQ